MEIKRLYLFVVAIFVISLVSAAQTDVSFDLKVSCEDFTCANVNVTVLYPNSTTLINNQPMTSNGYYANYTLTPTVNGAYDYYYSDGGNTSNGLFIASPTGFTLSIGTSILYAIMLIFLVFIFSLTLYSFIVMDGKNQRNTQGEVISVNWKKYLKMFTFGVCYASMTGILFVLWTLSWAFLEWQALGVFFHYWFRLWFIGGLLFLPFLFIFAIVYYIQDKKIESFINKMGIPYYNGK